MNEDLNAVISACHGNALCCVLGKVLGKAPNCGFLLD